MSLPVPNLDDRRFQDLVDEAKRLVQQRCPEWTDHNVSDPGVTLIESFAMMVDQLLYRLNRVPDLHYLRFLDLIGVKLFPPTAARTPVTYWLSAARDEPVRVPAGSPVATDQSGGTEAPVVFRTEGDLQIVPCSLEHLYTGGAGGRLLDQTGQLQAGTGVRCFGETPAPDECVYFGLSNAVPRCAVQLRVSCRAEGVGVDPEHPPWTWEAFDGTGWVACEIESDTTGGFNQDGITVVHVPPSHTEALLERERAGWLRVRLTRADNRPFYRDSPRLVEAAAATIGGTVDAAHAHVVADEVVGLSEGVPGQRFRLAHRPVISSGEPLVVEVAGGDDWQAWHEVETFAESGPDSRHFTLDAIGGEIRFGPAVRNTDGSIRHFGAVPPKAAPIRVPRYRTGGGKTGNVARGLLRVQRDPVPFVTRVTNRRAATLSSRRSASRWR
jgi:predicted phage baseplate assembly protein